MKTGRILALAFAAFTVMGGNFAHAEGQSEEQVTVYNNFNRPLYSKFMTSGCELKIITNAEGTFFVPSGLSAVRFKGEIPSQLGDLQLVEKGNRKSYYQGRPIDKEVDQELDITFSEVNGAIQPVKYLFTNFKFRKAYQPHFGDQSQSQGGLQGEQVQPDPGFVCVYLEKAAAQR